MRRELLERVLVHDHLAELDPAERRLALRDVLLDGDDGLDLPASLAELADAIDGFGPLTPLMEEEGVTDVLVNGPNEVWVDRGGRLVQTHVRFDEGSDLLAFVERMLASTGARADTSNPIADARLRDGSRIHVVLPPVAPLGPLVSIRRFPSIPLTLDDLATRDMMDADQATRLRTALATRATIAISGGTGSGKTTLLNALLTEIDEGQRVVVLEETAELRPRGHHVSLLTRDPNLEGVGRVDLEALVRASLRMRPDRIVVGEVRGAEALAALGALSVGHEGSLLTVHARSASSVTDRLVSLALLARSGASEAALRRQVAAAFDLFVHLERGPTGERRITEICESSHASR